MNIVATLPLTNHEPEAYQLVVLVHDIVMRHHGCLQSTESHDLWEASLGSIAGNFYIEACTTKQLSRLRELALNSDYWPLFVNDLPLSEIEKLTSKRQVMSITLRPRTMVSEDAFLVPIGLWAQLTHQYRRSHNESVVVAFVCDRCKKGHDFVVEAKHAKKHYDDAMKILESRQLPPDMQVLKKTERLKNGVRRGLYRCDGCVKEVGLG